MRGFEKYIPLPKIENPHRLWPDRVQTAAPIWCSVDLRDGNQALVNPMSAEDKLLYFKALTKIGLKQIEVGFPSASETEYEAVRALIDGGHIPEGVAIQVMTTSRPEHIRRTFESIRGARDVIIQFYVSVSELQRRVVFERDRSQMTSMAQDAARLIRELTEQAAVSDPGCRISWEFTPESFMGTELDYSLELCAGVMDVLGATPENKLILSLPATVECQSPNRFADLIEVFCRRLPNRSSAIVSLHTHNDRGCAVAAAELSLLAGAERVEATLFGSGERTGNSDLVTLALNLYTQGVDPQLELSDLPSLISIYEAATGMQVPPRQPYSGSLALTAFAGSHQDALNKGLAHMRSQGGVWEVPYLPIDPADVGRSFAETIRVNSQSGKAGPAYILSSVYGFQLPKAMQTEFSATVQQESERLGVELSAGRIYSLFKREYLDVDETYTLLGHRFSESSADDQLTVSFTGLLRHKGAELSIAGIGNGPIDAFFNAVRGMRLNAFEFLDYSEHAISSGSDSRAAAYIHLKAPNGKSYFGVGLSHNIYLASIRGVVCAINRAIIDKEGHADTEPD